LVIGALTSAFVCEERVDQIEIASQHRGVQGGIADRGRVRIRAFLEQQRRDATVAAVRGKDESTGSIRERVVDVGAGGQQQPGLIRRRPIAPQRAAPCCPRA
jgi:hypothetical protein